MKKKTIVIITVCVMCIVLVFGIVGISQKMKAEPKKTENTLEGDVQKGNIEGESINVSGTTTAGVDYEYFPISLSFPIEVEEVYVKTGTEVSTQSAILKITDTSYEKMKKSLKSAFVQTKADLAQSKIDYKTDLLELKSELSSDNSVSSTAYEEYENTVETLETQVKLEKEELASITNILEKYPEKIQKEEEQIKKKQQNLNKIKEAKKKNKKEKNSVEKKYEEAEKAYVQAQNNSERIETVQEYVKNYTESNQQETTTKVEKLSETKKSEKTEENSTMVSGEISTDSFTTFQNQLIQNSTEAAEKLNAAKSEYDSWKTKLEAIENNISGQEEKITTLENKIQTLKKQKEQQKTKLQEAKANYNSAEAAYEKAKADETAETITAEKQLQQNLLTKSSGAISYQLQLKSLDETLKEAEDAYKEAKENWETFNKTFSEGIWYADREGTISYLECEKGSVITNQDPVFGYYNGDMISVSVTVDQSQIASISVGNDVAVMTTSARGRLSGKVEKINNTQNSTSVSKVTYEVTIGLDNTDGKLSSGDTAEVMFSSEELENVLYLPAQLLQEDTQGSFVTVEMEDGTTKKKRVTIGANNGHYAEIKSGLEEGDHCIVNQPEKQEETE